MTYQNDKTEITEGAVCPECGDGVVKVKGDNPSYMECTHCHAGYVKKQS